MCFVTFICIILSAHPTIYNLVIALFVRYYFGIDKTLVINPLLSVDFVIDKKGTPLLEAYNTWRNRADPKVCCDYGLHMGVTHWNDSVAKEMEILCTEKGNEIYSGITVMPCIGGSIVYSGVTV